MATELSIINLSRSLLGEETVLTLDLTNPDLQATSDLYETIKKNLLEQYDWNFAKSWAILVKSEETPADPNYMYSYNVPGDLLKIIDTYPSRSDYAIVRDKIYSNIDKDFRIRYIANVNVEYFTTYFEMVLVHELALYSCNLITGKSEKIPILKQWSDQVTNDAMHFDSVSTKSEKIVANELSIARLNGGY